MKNLLSLIAVFTIVFTSSVFAENGYTPFTTPEEAQQYCPATVNGLTFIPNNPSFLYSAGTITGNNHGVFESFPPRKSLRPKNMGAGNVILDAEFRSADGIYGYINNNIVTCLYSYRDFANGNVALALRGK